RREFPSGGLRRTAPAPRSRVALLQAAAGQFLFDAGRITTLHDFELACLGDPMAEFAGLRNRTLSEPLGDLRRALRRYEELSGEPVDLRAIDFHTVRFGLVTPPSTAPRVAAPPPGLGRAAGGRAGPVPGLVPGLGPALPRGHGARARNRAAADRGPGADAHAPLDRRRGAGRDALGRAAARLLPGLPGPNGRAGRAL